MENNELRIGNLVDFNGQVETVYAIRNSGVDFYRGKTKKSVIMQSYVWEAIKPIPLTEEWLLKFGFKRFPWGLVKDNLLFKDDLKCSYLILQVGNGFEVKVKYVHELQNLYFALTGSELTVA